MKYQINFLCFLFALMTFVPLSYVAADELPDNITLGNTTPSVLGAQSVMSNDDIMKIVEQSLGAQASTKASENAAVTVLTGEEDEDENKVFRYDGKRSVFDGALLPQRTFNNIPYPY